MSADPLMEAYRKMSDAWFAYTKNRCPETLDAFHDAVIALTIAVADEKANPKPIEDHLPHWVTK